MYRRDRQPGIQCVCLSLTSSPACHEFRRARLSVCVCDFCAISIYLVSSFFGPSQWSIVYVSCELLVLFFFTFFFVVHTHTHTYRDDLPASAAQPAPAPASASASASVWAFARVRM